MRGHVQKQQEGILKASVLAKGLPTMSEQMSGQTPQEASDKSSLEDKLMQAIMFGGFLVLFVGVGLAQRFDPGMMLPVVLLGGSMIVLPIRQALGPGGLIAYDESEAAKVIHAALDQKIAATLDLNQIEEILELSGEFSMNASDAGRTDEDTAGYLAEQIEYILSEAPSSELHVNKEQVEAVLAKEDVYLAHIGIIDDPLRSDGEKITEQPNTVKPSVSANTDAHALKEYPTLEEIGGDYQSSAKNK